MTRKSFMFFLDISKSMNMIVLAKNGRKKKLSLGTIIDLKPNSNLRGVV